VGLKVSSLGGEVGLNDTKLAEALLIVGTELGVAVWLLSGIAEVWSRRAVMLLLMVFIVAAGQRLLTGNSDCGCFGAVHVPPALTLAFDLTSLAALYLLGRAEAAAPNSRPNDDAASGHRPNQIRAAVALGAFFVMFALTALRLGPAHE
jgi:hypothetical protein